MNFKTFNRKIEISHTEDTNLRSKSTKQVTGEFLNISYLTERYFNDKFLVTSANPTLMSSPKIEENKIEEEEEYDEEEGK